MSPVLGAILTASSIILGFAGLVSLAAAWRRHRADRVSRPASTPHRARYQFADELRRIGRELAADEQPTMRLPVTGRVDRDRVDQAVTRAHGDDDTRELHLPGHSRHAAPERDELLRRLRAGGWPRTHLRRLH